MVRGEAVYVQILQSVAFAKPFLPWKSYKYYIFWGPTSSLSHHAKRMRRILFSSVAFPDLPFFQHYLINGTIFWKGLLNIKRVLWPFLQLLYETYLILRRIQHGTIIHWHRCPCKIRVIVSDCNGNWIFGTDLRHSNNKFCKNPSSGCRVVPGGRPDKTKLTVASRNFADATEKLIAWKLNNALQKN